MLLVLHPKYTTTKDTKSTKEENSMLKSGCPFFMSFVPFVVNRKTLVEHHGGGYAPCQRDDNLQRCLGI